MSKDGELGTLSAVTLMSMVDENSLRSEDGKDERLLPGLPNEIILDHVVPKLPWRTFHILSSVSFRWREAIQSRHVYDVRVRSHSTEKLLVLNHTSHDGEHHVISLYSVRDNSWHQLPQFPKSWKSQKGIPMDCRCISLDGKIYVLGGINVRPGLTYCPWSSDYRPNYCSEVYVLDLAGQREWKKCAKLPQPRYSFGCDVVDGKIYVLGGVTGNGSPARVSLVYDPKSNVWSSILPMKYMRRSHQVVTVGEELFVHGGLFRDPEHDGNNYPSTLDAKSTAEVYHAGKDEWRLVKPFTCHESARLFTAQCKLYMTSPLAIYRQDIDSQGNYSWTHLHSLSFGDDSAVIAAQVVNNELLVIICEYDANDDMQTFLCESIGFGSKQKEIAWDKIASKPWEYRPFELFLSAIQL